MIDCPYCLVVRLRPNSLRKHVAMIHWDRLTGTL